MGNLEARIWPHDESCCGRPPLVGAIYERQSIDLFTGAMGKWETYTVVYVAPIRFDRVFCRRVHIRCHRTGKVYKPQVASFWNDRYRAVGNVIQLWGKIK